MARDSLDIVELFMELEREFGDIADEALERIWPRGDITVGVIYQTLTGSEAAPAPNDSRWRRLVTLIATFMEVPVDDVTWDTRPFH